MINCKLCSALATLPRDEALEFNQILFSKEISAAKITPILVKHFGPIGVTTVKRHRKESHSDF